MKANWIVLAAALQGTQLGGMRLAGIILAAVGFVLIAAGIVYGRGGKKEAAYKPNKTNKPEAITVTAESIIGDRKYQQDFFLFTPDTNSDAVKDSGMLAIVCDGMGGMEGGEIASRMCAELVYNGYIRWARSTMCVRCSRSLSWRRMMRSPRSSTRAEESSAAARRPLR